MEENNEQKVILTMQNGYDNAVDKLYERRESGETVYVSDEIAFTLADNNARIAAKETLSKAASLVSSGAIIATAMCGLAWLIYCHKANKRK